MNMKEWNLGGDSYHEVYYRKLAFSYDTDTINKISVFNSR